MGYTVGVAGASGYAGGELVRLVDAHPEFELGYLAAHSKAGSTLGEIHPNLRDPDRVLLRLNPSDMADLDLVFLALPHGASAAPAMELLDHGVRVVDLGSDFRLDTPERYETAYGSAHPYPEELGQWAYGIPELFSADISATDRTAAPGCYPTSALLALAPLVSSGIVEPAGIVVDAVSGVSGAGRSVKPELGFGAVAEGVRAYGVATHRHRPEMQRVLATYAEDASVVFTPHLVPMQRGILATCYVKPRAGIGFEEAAAALTDAYEKATFVDVIDQPPQTRWVVGSNRALLSIHHDVPTDTYIVLAALDNLVKGAAGQAVQCANLMLGIDESVGLTIDGWMP